MKGIYIVLLMMISATGFINAQNKDSVLELNSNWEYTHFPYCQTDEESLEKTNFAKWNTAVVPGDVHLDLERNGVLSNLYYGLNFYSSVWVEHEDFMYHLI